MFWSCWDAFTNQICSSGAVGIGTLLAVGLLVPPVSVRMSPRIGMNVFPYRNCSCTQIDVAEVNVRRV
ncbi:hypothetical protein V6N13_104577 [Hibiscus sabdariffa]